MATTAVLASKDPTFETQGPMGIFLSNQTDWGYTTSIMEPEGIGGISVGGTPPTLTYGGGGQPPPPWTQGTDWKVAPDLWQLMPAQFVTPSPPVWTTAGSTCVMSVTDRSSNKVALGAQYVFDQRFVVAGTVLGIHYTVSGVAGGSTVLPGFGLWDLRSNPGAWTYLTPTTFDGTWSIQLRSDDFLTYATLSVTYAPYSTMNNGGPAMSRLFYSVSGSVQARYAFPITQTHRLDEPARLPADPAKVKPNSSIDIVRR